MANKKITDLQLISTITDAVNFVVDDTLQSYRSTGAKLFDYVRSKIPPAPGEIANTQLATSVASSALTIALKTNAGTDPTTLDRVRVAFRSATLTSSLYNLREVTSALSIVIPSGATLGQVSGMAARIFVYLIDNAGVLELAVSLNRFADDALVSTTALSGSSNSALTMYSTTARSNVPSRLIGYLDNTQTTAGTWASTGTKLQLTPFTHQSPGSYLYSAYYIGSQTNFWQRTSASYGDFTVTGTIPSPIVIKNSNFGTVSKATSNLPGFNFVAPRTGTIKIVCEALMIPGQVAGTTSGSFRLLESTTSTDIAFGSAAISTNNTTNAIFPITMVGFFDATFGVTYNFKLQGAQGSGTIYIGATNTEKQLGMVFEYIT